MSIGSMCLTSILPRGSVSNRAATWWNVLPEMLMRPGSQASCRRCEILAVLPQKPVLRLEPLPALLEQAEDGGGAVADLSRKLGQRIVSEFRRRINDLVEGEGGQAIRLVHGHRLEHGPLPGVVLSLFGWSGHRGDGAHLGESAAL